MKFAVSLAKNISPPLGITTAASAIDARIQKKIYGSGTTILVVSSEEMNDVLKIVQALEGSNILLKGVTKTIKNETKENIGGFLSMLLGKFWNSKTYENEPRINGLFPRKILPKITENDVKCNKNWWICKC